MYTQVQAGAYGPVRGRCQARGPRRISGGAKVDCVQVWVKMQHPWGGHILTPLRASGLADFITAGRLPQP